MQPRWTYAISEYEAANEFEENEMKLPIFDKTYHQYIIKLNDY